MTYPLSLHDGHAIFQTADGQSTILVDTGVPFSFHTANVFQFEGASFATKVNLSGINVQEVSRLVGTNITTLMGGDILSKFKVCLDYHNLTISFEPLSYSIEEGDRIPVQLIDGFMMLPVTINGFQTLSYLDTGAKLSYIGESLQSGLTANPERSNDFYIGIGNYDTVTFSTVATLSNGDQFPGTFGTLPSRVSAQFFSAEKQAIVGSDLFNHYQKVWIDYSNKCIHVLA